MAEAMSDGQVTGLNFAIDILNDVYENPRGGHSAQLVSWSDQVTQEFESNDKGH